MIIGTVGRVDIKQLDSGKMAHFSVVTSEKYKDRTGSIKEDSTWHNCVSFGNAASIVERFVDKGSSIFVEGRIRKRKWNDRDGNEKETTEIAVDNIQLLGKKQQHDDRRYDGNDMDF